MGNYLYACIYKFKARGGWSEHSIDQSSQGRNEIKCTSSNTSSPLEHLSNKYIAHISCKQAERELEIRIIGWLRTWQLIVTVNFAVWNMAECRVSFKLRHCWDVKGYKWVGVSQLCSATSVPPSWGTRGWHVWRTKSLKTKNITGCALIAQFVDSTSVIPSGHCHWCSAQVWAPQGLNLGILQAQQVPTLLVFSPRFSWKL